MTVAELYDQVAQLGFEDSVERETNFYHALNRAVFQASLLRPRYTHVDIHHYPLPSVANVSDHIAHANMSGSLVYMAPSARSYYFECNGNGKCYIEAIENDGSWETVGEIQLSTLGGAYREYRGFIKRDGKFFDAAVRFRFESEFYYAVRNLALYQVIYSENINDIPAFAPFIPYNIGNMCNDFLSLAPSPVVDDENGQRLGNGYSVEDSRIVLLPRSMPGDYKIAYRRKPRVISSDDEASTNDTAIDLDEDIASLLPLLVAAYVWLEDEEETAARYMELYRERAAEIMRTEQVSEPAVIRSHNNW